MSAVCNSATFRRRMGSEITGDGDEDMPAFVGVAPLAELSHAGVQHLVGMEPCVLAQQRPRQRGDQRLHRVTKREMTRDKTRGEIDLSLPIECVEQSEEDLLDISGQVIKRSAVIAGNTGGRHIEIASKVEQRAIAPCRTPRTASTWSWFAPIRFNI